MFKTSDPVIREIITGVSVTETAAAFEKALELIGHRKAGNDLHADYAVIEGSSSYGLQKIPLKIEINVQDSESAHVRITAGFRDLSNKGAQRCAGRLLNAYRVFESGSPEEKKALTTRSSFELKTGISKTKLAATVLIFTVGFSILYLLMYGAFF